MKEIVMISGKGGTGKTSLTASFALLAHQAGDKTVLADCDVDASDLPLVLDPRIRKQEPFMAGNEARIAPQDCTGCGQCVEVCRFEAIVPEDGETPFRVDPFRCEGCRVCVDACPAGAIAFVPRTGGEWFESDSRAGSMVHGRLEPGGENSGKLVTLVRQGAKRIASQEDARRILVDGPPGTGCPVIASLTGASGVVVITEPTPSGEHDLKRVLELTRHFRIPSAISVNKWDLNPAVTEHIEEQARERGARVLPRVRFDPVFTQAQVRGLSLAECPNALSSTDVRELWKQVQEVFE